MNNNNNDHFIRLLEGVGCAPAHRAVSNPCNSTTIMQTREQQHGSLPVYIYVLMVAFLVIGTLAICVVIRKVKDRSSETVTPYIVGTAEGRTVDEEEDDEEDAAMKRVIRARVVREIFPTQIVESSDLHILDPEANTVEWIPKQQQSDSDDGNSTVCNNNKKKNNNNKDATCSICIDHFRPADVVATTVLCSHAFHFDCIVGWSEIKSECPICRQPMWSEQRFEELSYAAKLKLESPTSRQPENGDDEHEKEQEDLDDNV